MRFRTIEFKSQPNNKLTIRSSYNPLPLDTNSTCVTNVASLGYRNGRYVRFVSTYTSLHVYRCFYKQNLKKNDRARDLTPSICALVVQKQMNPCVQGGRRSLLRGFLGGWGEEFYLSVFNGQLDPFVSQLVECLVRL